MIEMIRVGSMFAGIGGICLGFKSAGADIVWANEIDHYACATYRHNFGSCYLVECDISQFNLSSIPEIDILTAGFPCQSFSVMGKQRGFADPRGSLYFEILKVIDVKSPRIVFLENVKNLLRHDRGRTFLTIYNTLAERGYGVKYAVIGAHTHANIPQYRDRIFIAAFRDIDKLDTFAFPSEIPLITQINDLIDRNVRFPKNYYYTEQSSYFSLLNQRTKDINAIYRIDDSGVAVRAWNIAPTLKANMWTYHDRVPLIRDTFGIRRLSPEECLALQGFPKCFEFPNILTKEIYKQIGNTVCVPVIVRIAQEILKTLK